jgi:hypothetical protein
MDFAPDLSSTPWLKSKRIPPGLSVLGTAPVVTAVNGGSVTVPFSTIVDPLGAQVSLQSGDLLVASFANNLSDYDITTSSTGWTEIVDTASVGTRVVNLGVYLGVYGAVGGTSFVGAGPGGTNTACLAGLIALRGADPANTLDVAVQLAGLTGSFKPNPPSATPATNNAIHVIIGAGAATLSSAYDRPGDLSATANHWQAGYLDEGVDASLGYGLKTGGAQGVAFDPAAWTGAAVDAAEQAAVAAHIIIREEI